MNNILSRKEKALRYGARYWDEVAERIRGNGLPIPKVLDEYHCSEIKKLVEKWAGENTGRTVLKTDLFEEAYRQPGWKFYYDTGDVIGMDISYLTTKRARDRAGRSKMVVADVSVLPFHAGSFDLIISHSTLDHLHSESVREALGELSRVLVDNGILIMTLDNKHNFLRNVMFILRKMRFLPSRSCYHIEKFYSLNEVSSLIKATGLKIVEYSAICHMFPFMKTILRTAPRFSDRIHHKIDGQILKLLRSMDRGKAIRFYTARFIAFKCEKLREKEKNGIPLRENGFARL